MRLTVLSRIAASLLGGWAFTWGFVALGVTLLVAAGMPYGEALSLLYMLAFLLFLGLFLWAMAAPSLARVWAVLAGGAAAMTLLAWWLTRSLH